MTVSLGWHSTLVLQWSFKFSNPIYKVRSINSNVTKCFDWIPLLTSPQYNDGDQYFYRDIFSRWLSSRAKEWFTCPCDGDYTLLGIQLVVQEVSGVIFSLFIFWYFIYSFTQNFAILPERCALAYTRPDFGFKFQPSTHVAVNVLSFCIILETPNYLLQMTVELVLKPII